jgi:hypothetical protein
MHTGPLFLESVQGTGREGREQREREGVKAVSLRSRGKRRARQEGEMRARRALV